MVIALLALDRTGLSGADYTAYYQGDEARELYVKSRAELLEVTHFHLFSYPLLILVQGHIFLLCPWPSRLKVGVVFAAFAGAAVYLAAPWLTAYGGAAWAWTSYLGRLLLAPPLLLFVLVPLYEMWLRKRPSTS